MRPRHIALLAQALIFIGWFTLDTLRTSLGSLGFDFHFYDMAAIIASPRRLELGVGDNASIITVPFAILCFALVLAPAFVPTRFSTAARLAPLLLMLVCGAFLYHIAQQDLFIAARNADDITTSIVQLANAITRRGGDLLTRHIGIGAGAWVAAAGALLLAYTVTRERGLETQAA
jgi:hypothetical protein